MNDHHCMPGLAQMWHSSGPRRLYGELCPDTTVVEPVFDIPTSWRIGSARVGRSVPGHLTRVGELVTSTASSSILCS
jgi:hypothetical protein